MTYQLFTDGGSRGNPGNAAIGCFLFDDSSKLIAFTGEFLGTATNNVAEYMALIEGIKLAKKAGVKNLVCNLDSELVVKQLKGEYKVKHVDMKPLYKKVIDEMENFDSVSFKHIPREENSFADKMVNITLDLKK